MKTKGRKENFRIVVDPRGLGDFGSIKVGVGLLYGKTEAERARLERDMADRCEEIARDIKRHVDNVGYVNVEFDQPSVCEHCGAEWTEASQVYNGGCCQRDEEGFSAEVTS